jgi:uncharacterized membrane protein
MVAPIKRLYFIDAMRAWAILMMLQGHFIDGLLDPVFRDPENLAFATWKYFRGITAPVFFTVSGFIFTYLLLRAPRSGKSNPRIRKGLKRGLQLVLIGYLLRTNIFGLLTGVIYPSFFLVDVLHCIGVSLIIIIGVYLLTDRLGNRSMATSLLLTGVVLFLYEPLYKSWEYGWMPDALANYFTKANGSVFTIIPWVGYALLGGGLATGFHKFRQDRYLYLKSIALCLVAGFLLIWCSSPFFSWVGDFTGVALFDQIVLNNYLFIRHGDVFLVFAVFMILRGLMEQRLFLRIGQNTLSIYVIHFIILYGSFTGFGLYWFFQNSLSPAFVIPGALLFMMSCTWAALFYDQREKHINQKIGELGSFLKDQASITAEFVLRSAKAQWGRLLNYFSTAKRS